MIVGTLSLKGIEQAAWELLEESLRQRERQRLEMFRSAQNFQAMMRGLEFERTLSPGYYDWALYLSELQSALDAGIEYRASEVPMVDVAGLRSLAAAERRFRREHPGCPHCGEALFEKLSYQCTMCGRNLKEAKAS